MPDVQQAFGSLLTAATLAMIPCFRRYFYEVFLPVHVGTTGVAAVALWRHLSEPVSQARYYILGGMSFWVISLCLSFLFDCYRNISLGRRPKLPKASIVKDYRTANNDQVVMAGACHVEIRLNRSFTAQPGEYLYICIPALGFPISMFQSHPFWIIWWDTDPTSGEMRLDLLVKQRRGFTRRLLSHRDKEYTAWISGPFGKTWDFGEYGTILMLAVDVGIAAHLPYLKSLMERRTNASICTRRVVVVWQVKDSSKDR